MYIRWKKRSRVKNARGYWYEPGGDLLVAYATESKRVNGQPRQTTTYLGSIRAGYCVGFDRHVDEILADVRTEKKEEVRHGLKFSHITRRLLFWRDVERALAKVPGADHAALKATLAKTVPPITKREAAVVFRECVSYPDGYPKMLEEIGFTRPDNVWKEPVDIPEEQAALHAAFKGAIG